MGILNFDLPRLASSRACCKNFAQNPSHCPNLQIRVAAAPMFATDDVPQTSTGFTVKLRLAAERFQDLVARLS
jgi:hypothetical protein